MPRRSLVAPLALLATLMAVAAPAAASDYMLPILLEDAEPMATGNEGDTEAQASISAVATTSPLVVLFALAAALVVTVGAMAWLRRLDARSETPLR